MQDKENRAFVPGFIPYIVKRFHNLDGETERERTEQRFFVPTEEILKELRKLEAEIKVEMDELEELLKNK